MTQTDLFSFRKPGTPTKAPGGSSPGRIEPVAGPSAVEDSVWSATQHAAAVEQPRPSLATRPDATPSSPGALAGVPRPRTAPPPAPARVTVIDETRPAAAAPPASGTDWAAVVARHTAAMRPPEDAPMTPDERARLDAVLAEANAPADTPPATFDHNETVIRTPDEAAARRNLAAASGFPPSPEAPKPEQAAVAKLAAPTPAAARALAEAGIAVSPGIVATPEQTETRDALLAADVAAIVARTDAAMLEQPAPAPPPVQRPLPSAAIPRKPSQVCPTVPPPLAEQQLAMFHPRASYPKTRHNASSVGHPCDWYLVGQIRHWQQMKPFDPGLLVIFKEGDRHERHTIEDLTKIGYELSHNQRSYVLADLRLSGRMEFMVRDLAKIEYLAEVKSMHPAIWDSIETLDDMIEHSSVIVRKYVAQLDTYILAAEREGIIPDDGSVPGLFILRNKSAGMLKPILVPRDLERRQALVERVHRINDHLDAGTEPPRLGDPRVCDGCPLRTICAPDMERAGLEWLDSPELLAALDRRAELAAARAEYEKLDKQVKGLLGRTEYAIVAGRYIVTGKEVQRKGYTVEPSEYWQIKIEATGRDADDDTAAGT